MGAELGGEQVLVEDLIPLEDSPNSNARNMAVTVSELTARIAELEETVRQLRAILRQGCTFTAEWDLTAAEEKLLSALYTRPSLTYHQAALAIEREPGGVPKPAGDGYHLVTQYAHRLRRKMERHGITITTIRGVGYKLDPENKRKVAAGVVAGTMLQTEKEIAR